MTTEKAAPGTESYTPPLWLRHVTPWSVLNFINDRYATCWAGMVMWKQGYDWSWWPDKNCFNSSPQRYDYCGKFKQEPRP